ncbi:hypothetical protein D5086_018162 [Populus alba]|uniref:Uncharacterized protein n=1 Tax=Populus alba TaxID=43335 RepID=A0ACC4BQA0_POPAL
MWVAGVSCPSWIGYMVEKEFNAVPSLGNCSDAAYVTEDLLEHLTVEGKQYPVPISINAWKVRKTLEALETTAYEGLGLNLREDIVINSKYNTRETNSFTVGMEVYGRAEDSTTVMIL